MTAMRRLAAILAADVAGYSRMIGADEDGTLDRLRSIRADVTDPKIAEHRGRIVKTSLRLSPREPTVTPLSQIGMAYFFKREFDEAASKLLLSNSRQSRPPRHIPLSRRMPMPIWGGGTRRVRSSPGCAPSPLSSFRAMSLFATPRTANCSFQVCAWRWKRWRDGKESVKSVAAHVGCRLVLALSEIDDMPEQTVRRPLDVADLDHHLRAHPVHPR
jgi:hypothetical protein